MVETASETMKDISNWLSENPLIMEDTAKDAKVFLDRGKLALKDLDDERDGKVRPLNEQVKEINGLYKAPRVQLETVLSGLSDRLSSFLKEERDKREEAAREAARIAKEAEQRARDAERIERDAIESASAGELGVDIAAHVVEADSAFRDFEKADRALAIALKETKVRVGGGFTRAVGLRQKETLVVKDAFHALSAMGVTPDIEEAILKSARAYRKLNGKLPDGVEATYTEEI
jgi:hypothetical protein